MTNEERTHFEQLGKHYNSDRDCNSCIHHTEKGCRKWDCEYEKLMSRVEENSKVIEYMRKSADAKPTGTFEEMTVFQLGVIATMLADISSSLAILADKALGEVGEQNVDT